MSNLNTYFPYAGFWWRWLAETIDCIILHIIDFIFKVVISAILKNIIIPFVLLSYFSSTVIWTYALLGLIFYWLYYAVMESSPWQATLGKKVCGLKVTDTEGQRLSFKRASGRYWAKLISGLTCLVGYIMAAFTVRKQALHDKIAKTLVLREVDN